MLEQDMGRNTLKSNAMAKMCIELPLPIPYFKKVMR